MLGDERGATFGRVYDVSDAGNFEGRNILNLPKTLEQCAKILGREPDELAAELADSREKLFAVREKRVRPGRDDKVIVAWNGLMIDAMARAGAALERAANTSSRPTRRPVSSLSGMRRDDGRLLHTWRDGQAKLDAYLDDYAALANCARQAVRSDLRRALDRRSGAAGGHRARQVRRSGRRRILLHGRRSRAAHRAHQGTHRQQHAQRQRAGGDGAAAAGQAAGPQRLPGRGRANAGGRACRSCSGRRWRPARCCSRSIATWARRTSWCSSATWAATTRRQAIAAIQRRYLPRTVFAVRDSTSTDPTRLAVAASRRDLRRQRIAGRPAGAVRLPELRLPGAGGGAGGD